MRSCRDSIMLIIGAFFLWASLATAQAVPDMTVANTHCHDEAPKQTTKADCCDVDCCLLKAVFAHEAIRPLRSIAYAVYSNASARAIFISHKPLDKPPRAA